MQEMISVKSLLNTNQPNNNINLDLFEIFKVQFINKAVESLF